jgi:Fe-S-cluster-containing hydrogenase component 2
MFQEIIERSALLIALVESYPDDIEVEKLDKVLSEWRFHIKFLQQKEIDIEITRDKIRLKKPVCFDLYQSVPPEIRTSVESILWRIIHKPSITDMTTLDQILVCPIEDTFNNFISQPPPSTKKINSNDTNWLIRGDKKFPVACIHCADAPCMTYGIEAFGPTDKFASLVCPANVIKQSPEGFISIDQSGCSGCMLCIIRCPINSIFYKNGVAVKREYSNLPERDIYVKEAKISFEKRKEITKEMLQKFSKALPPFQLEADIKEILDNFEHKVSGAELNWGQDPYYVWIRNCFRELGLQAAYTGPPGKLKCDVTIQKPFMCGMEVKSPAEGDISVGAIRQAADAKREVIDTYNVDKNNTYCAAIGHDIERGTHRRAKSWSRSFGIKVPLIRGRYLLYLVLKHKIDLPQDPDKDVRQLFIDFEGWFGNEEFAEYFRKYFETRSSELNKGAVALLLPPKVQEVLRKEGTDKALRTLQQLEKAIYKEIKHCFPDPERKARGGYTVK